MELVFQIVETVVDRCGAEHQDLGLNAGANDLIHQPLVAILFSWRSFCLREVFNLVYISPVSKIMAFVYHYQVIIAPIDIGKIQSVAFAMFSGQIRMKQYIIS